MYEELREMNNEIRAKTERIAELRASLTSINSPLSEKVQTSPTDRLSNLMCKIIILENELDEMIDEYADLKAMITGEIFSLENEGWQDLLYSHYVEFKPWGEIAESRNTTIKAVLRKKDRAIKKLKSIKIDTKSC
jgi:hypothetical protein